jgi:hypothetical protein
MGTNYYLHKPPCPQCNHATEPTHIGKASRGWCFSLCYNKELGLLKLEDWQTLLKLRLAHPDWYIEDEYGDKVTYEDLISIITKRRSLVTVQENVEAQQRSVGADFAKNSYLKSVEAYLERNHAIIGPNNLLRHALGQNCVSHGEGTWDMIEGEFS